MYIARIQVKKGQRTDLSQTKKKKEKVKKVFQNKMEQKKKNKRQIFLKKKKKKEIVKNVFQNKMEQIKKNANQLQKILVQVKEGKYYLKKN